MQKTFDRGLLGLLYRDRSFFGQEQNEGGEREGAADERLQRSDQALCCRRAKDGSQKRNQGSFLRAQGG